MATPNPGKLLNGQQFDPRTNFTVPYTERMLYESAADALVGQAATEIVPVDGHASRVRVFTGPTALFDAFYLEFPGFSNLSGLIPDELTGVTVTFNKTTGNGENTHPAGAHLSFGRSGGLSISPSSSAQGSAAILPDVQPTVIRYSDWAKNVPVRHGFIYKTGNLTNSSLRDAIMAKLAVAVSGIAAGTVTCTSPHGFVANQPIIFLTLGAPTGVSLGTVYYVRAGGLTSTTFTFSATSGGSSIAASAATSSVAPYVASWPQFRPAAVELTLNGQQVSVSVSADSYHMDRWTTEDGSTQSSVSFSRTTGNGFSRQNGVSVRHVTVPPTIHGALSITGDTDTSVCEAEVTADIDEIVGAGGAPDYDAITNGPHDESATATGSVTPNSIGATTGQATMPIVGLYLLQTDTDIHSYNYNIVHFVLVDFIYFAP